MLVAVIYASVRLVLDLARVRLRLTDAEAEVILLRHQLRVLQRQVRQPRLEPGDRLILAALARSFSRALAACILVRPETVLGWHRELVRRKWAAFGRRAGAGRPRLDAELRRLILEMARDNPRWGCVRIRGELLKLGHRVSTSAIRRLLRRRGLGPAPKRSQLSWAEFLRAQALAIVVTDFFTVDTIFLTRLYVLVHMELASRRVIHIAVTEHPDSYWVAQQTRNLVWELESIGTQPRFLIRDNDAKFGGPADAVLSAEGIRVIKTPIAAPRANAFMERQIGRRGGSVWTGRWLSTGDTSSGCWPNGSPTTTKSGLTAASAWQPPPRRCGGLPRLTQDGLCDGIGSAAFSANTPPQQRDRGGRAALAASMRLVMVPLRLSRRMDAL